MLDVGTVLSYDVGYKCFATNLFRPFHIFIPRISLFADSIATQSQMYAEPALINVSFMMNSLIFLFFIEDYLRFIFLYQFQIED